METSVIYSTLFLTLLLLVGLFFFIRAAVKERIERITLITDTSEDAILEKLKTYFEQRAYQVKAIDPQQNQVTFTGLLRPSWFLAIFLTLLAAIGLMCLGLLLSFLATNLTPFIPLLTLVAPLAGLFYWKQAGRPETVSVQVGSAKAQTLLTVTGHRDELKQLQKQIPGLKSPL